MSDEKKLITDDDWKEQARQEKERLAQEEARITQEPLPAPGFMDVVNLIALQAMVGLGLLTGPDGERVPPSLDVAKHFIDLLAVLQDKTKNNLDPEEKQTLDAVTYDLRMRFVQIATGAPPVAPGPGTPPVPPPPG